MTSAKIFYCECYFFFFAYSTLLYRKRAPNILSYRYRSPNSYSITGREMCDFDQEIWSISNVMLTYLKYESIYLALTKINVVYFEDIRLIWIPNSHQYHRKIFNNIQIYKIKIIICVTKIASDIRVWIRFFFLASLSGDSFGRLCNGCMTKCFDKNV